MKTAPVRNRISRIVQSYRGHPTVLGRALPTKERFENAIDAAEKSGIEWEMGLVHALAFRHGGREGNPH